MAINPVNKLYPLLDQCMLSDRQGFYRSILSLKKKPSDREKLENLERKISQSIEKAIRRSKTVPDITFPDLLPISQKRELFLKP